MDTRDVGQRVLFLGLRLSKLADRILIGGERETLRVRGGGGHQSH